VRIEFYGGGGKAIGISPVVRSAIVENAAHAHNRSPECTHIWTDDFRLRFNSIFGNFTFALLFFGYFKLVFSCVRPPPPLAFRWQPLTF